MNKIKDINNVTFNSSDAEYMDMDTDEIIFIYEENTNVLTLKEFGKSVIQEVFPELRGQSTYNHIMILRILGYSLCEVEPDNLYANDSYFKMFQWKCLKPADVCRGGKIVRTISFGDVNVK